MKRLLAVPMIGFVGGGLEGSTRRAIDFHEDDEIEEKAFATVIRAAVSLNESSSCWCSLLDRSIETGTADDILSADQASLGACPRFDRFRGATGTRHD
jgi:hypothetical protein